MDRKDETVFQPIPRKDDGTQFLPSASAPAPPLPPRPPSASPASSSVGPGMQAGTVLNRMYQVTQLLGRDRTGEVFEGVNIANGERVAIRVIPPALAASATIMDMVRKEVPILAQLSHPALTRYRLEAQEPSLGCHYVITSFVEGRSLPHFLGLLRPSVAEVVALTRRLAEGLREAHEAGVIHRDLSPDTIVLEDDQLAGSRIVDFGVTKDLSADAQTVIGHGFAGKMRYAAPEQLGDFDQSVGPWTDVYSLGLIILALAQGKEADLGGLPVEAVMKRRAGVDTSGAPAELRPLLERMLAADPQQRLRSMDEVIAALPKVGGGSSRKWMAIGGVAGILVVLGAVAVVMLGGRQGAPTAAPTTAAIAPAAPTASLAELDSRINAVLPTLACSWATVTTANDAAGVTLTGRGVAGRPDDVEARIYDAVRASGASVASSDFSGVAPIDAPFCPMLTALSTIRNLGVTHLTSAQSRYEIGYMEEGAYAGQKGAHVILDLSLEGIEGDFALYAVERSKISQIFSSRAAFLAASEDNEAIEKLAGIDHYRLTLDGTPAPGWSGILLVTGRGGFTESAFADLGGSGREAFDQAAKANGWKAEIAWYKFVDETPDLTPPPPSSSPSETPVPSATASPKT